MKVKDGLYHKEIGLPANAVRAFSDLPLRLAYSEHAIRAANNDRYGSIPLYGEIEFAPAEIIEVEMVDNNPVKAVCRIQSEDREHLDMVFVINAPDLQQRAVVRTVWYNSRADTHRTLRRDAYIRP